METPKNCPQCNENMIYGEIPAIQKHNYGDDYFYNWIGVYSVEKDRTVAFRCPSCGSTFEADFSAMIAKGASV